MPYDYLPTEEEFRESDEEQDRAYWQGQADAAEGIDNGDNVPLWLRPFYWHGQESNEVLQCGKSTE